MRASPHTSPFNPNAAQPTRPRIFRRIAPLILIALCATVYPGCAPKLQRHDWSSYNGPGAEYFHRDEYELPFAEDPLEPVNRVAFGLNAALIVAVADPLAAGWRFLVPAHARTALVHASNNIEYPRRGLNHLLQARPDDAETETARFALNSTIGVIGLHDAAANRGLEAVDTDTGKTLQHWGWTESAYLTLPFGAPGTVRDAIGGIGDVLLDPTFYFFPAFPIKTAIVGAEQVDDAKRFIVSHQDAYEPARRIYLAQRQNGDAPIASPDADGPALQTLGYLYFEPGDPWFASRAKTLRVPMRETGRSLPCDVWMQPTPAPLVFLLPGFGMHRQALANVAMAEFLFEAGYSVATISSAMNFEFIRNAASGPLPGAAPRDAADIHRALFRIAADLDRQHAGLITARAVVGISMGGYHALYMAGATPRMGLAPFDACVAVCPPIRLAHAAETVDAFYNAPMGYPPHERDDRAVAALRAGAQHARGARNASPLSEHDARFLVGVNYRLALHDMIWAARDRHDAGILRTEWSTLWRAPASQEILDYSLMEYAYGFLLPDLTTETPTARDAEDMFARSDLRSCEGVLRSRSNVAVVTNRNDFLLADGDIAWLRSVLGPARLTVHPCGGHVGNLGDAAMRQSILDQLRALLN